MKTVYYKDSFPLEIRLADCKGDALKLGDVRWSARIYTPGSLGHVAISYDGAVAKGWKPGADGGSIVVAMDGHGLAPGPLVADFLLGVPDSAMPDGIRELHRRVELDVRLTAEPCSCQPTVAEVRVLLPLVKGEPGEPMRWSLMDAEERRELVAEVSALVEQGHEEESLSEWEVGSMLEEIFGIRR